MKKFFNIAAISLLMAFGFSSCEDYFDTVPGEQYDMDDTFSDRGKTEQFLTNVYHYIPDETRERYTMQNTYRIGSLATGCSLEANITWNWHVSNEWTMGLTYASSAWIQNFYKQYYMGISKASTFIANVDKCAQASANDRKVWKAQARAVRALYYYYLFRLYGPVVMLGDEELDRDTPLENLLRERSTVDECVKFIVDELDLAAEDLPDKYTGSNLGRVSKAVCKAYKAKLLLYAASPLFNGNTDYASIKNADGTPLFPQEYDPSKWDDARQAYEEFFRLFGNQYELYTVKAPDGTTDFFESYRQATDGVHYGDDNREQIFVCVENHTDHTYEVTPYHAHLSTESSIRGGLGFGTTQEMVDLFFTDKGLRIVDDPDYEEYEGIPDASFYTVAEDYNNPKNPDRNYFLKRNEKENKPNYVLKQWKNREARFYANVTFSGSTWIKDDTNQGMITTDLTLNGNSGPAKSSHDAPLEGYGVRKMAPINGVWNGQHCSILLRLADMYLGYAEVLSACGQYEKAIEYVNLVRARAGIPAYGNKGGVDTNGLAYIEYPVTKDEVDNRIRRERLIELSYEHNRYYDVRRWKVADMAVGDNWIYPSYHLGGEGGAIHGMNTKADVPGFFEKVVTETRVFNKRHYFYPIPDAEIRRNTKMVQNLGWSAD